jgi:pSer/pThr/pTyr-binding forkhead associated (FHA) protein
MSKLVLTLDNDVIEEVPLERGQITVGRKEGNDIVIKSKEVSGAHAKFYNYGGNYFIQDLNSLNGTFVNGKKITRHTLKHGDQISIGHYILHFTVVDTKEDDTQELELKEEQKPVVDRETVQISKKEEQEMTGALGGFLVIEGSTDENVYELPKGLTVIGKAENADIKLKSLFAPKVAAFVNRKANGYHLSPSDEKKGVKINNQPLEKTVVLSDGDIVEAGGLKLQFYTID